MTSVDIALLGATGFTGALTADYLSTHLPDGATWAIAGRNQAKLEAVADRVVALGGVRPEIISADSTNAASMSALAGSTRVLITTVGPYLAHGEPAVKAAAEAGIAYVDLTGEPEFVDRMWLKYDEVAEKSGARIIHACGFDSIPYDLGVLFTVEQMPEGVPIVGQGLHPGRRHGLGRHVPLRDRRHGRHPRRRQDRRRAQAARSPVPRAARSAGAARWAAARAARAGPCRCPRSTRRSSCGRRGALERYGPDFSYAHFAQFKRLPMLAAHHRGRRRADRRRPAASHPGAAAQAQEPGRRTRRGQARRVVVQAAPRRRGRRKDRHDRGERGRPRLHRDRQDAQRVGPVAWPSTTCRKVSGQTTTAVAMGDALIERLQKAGITFRTL